jgi:hypothetical protein
MGRPSLPLLHVHCPSKSTSQGVISRQLTARSFPADRFPLRLASIPGGTIPGIIMPVRRKRFSHALLPAATIDVEKE